MDPQQEIPLESVPEPAGDRRRQLDRRREPTSPWAALRSGGRRMENRRAEQERQPYYVDRFSSALLAGVLALVAASLVDAGLTLYILFHGGGVEVNPLMRCLLDRGVATFLVGKYLLTVAGIPVLLIFKNHRLFGVRVERFIPAVVAMYAVLIGYQIVMIHRHMGW